MKAVNIPRSSHLLGKVTAAAALVFFVAVIMAVPRSFGSTETKLFLDIYHLPGFLRWPFLVITQAGSVWMALIVFSYLWVRKKYDQDITLGALIALTFGLVEVIKHLIARPRPFQVLADVVSREPLVHGYGFPSGHAAMATLMALSVYRFLPKAHAKLIVAGWIVLVCISRVYLGVHAPLDVIAGASLGALVSTLPSWLKKLDNRRLKA